MACTAEFCLAESSPVVVTVHGEIDLCSAPKLREALREAMGLPLTSAQDPRILVDLRRVTFIDAAGLGVLVGAAARARQAGRRLTLVDPTPATLRLLRITGLHRVFQLEGPAQRQL
jgi:anti-sigma B factor antagonist